MSACQLEADWAWHFRCDIFGVTFQVGQMMKKRSLSIKGHMTSISLEDAFWAELGRIAEERGASVAVDGVAGTQVEMATWPRAPVRS